MNQLLSGSDSRAALADEGLLDGLKKALAERGLNAELDHHLEGGEPDDRPLRLAARVPGLPGRSARGPAPGAHQPRQPGVVAATPLSSPAEDSQSPMTSL
jgi:hypothetical protein